MKSADMMLYVASSAMKAGLPHVLVFDRMCSLVNTPHMTF
jgi:hypothetical protein